MTLADLRNEYTLSGLTETDAGLDPFALFARWFDQAVAANLYEVNAMTLATASAAGKPSARIVLLKAADAQGFCFFTNYHGRKAREIAANPSAALVIHWAALERQVRVEGTVAKTTDSESDLYFAGRPRGSQLGSWASPQSEVLPDRVTLETRLAEIEAKFPDVVPRPPNWGGYRLTPDMIEFWQGRPRRLHDRLRFTRTTNGWLRERLGP